MKLLSDYLAQQCGRFDWAERNCCHFAAGWVQARTGVDPMAGLPETLDEKAARRLIKRLGGSLEAAWTKQLGQEPLPPLVAQVGDLVLLPANAEGGFAVGVCTGAEVAVLLSGGAIGLMPLREGRACWRIG